mmetsp:Transcript_9884/g.14460  ORF Transcript_9884/g.14460 Transcript_9884/m.14460 type:complete len:147 (+) Transcript_9884:75-515(+)
MQIEYGTQRTEYFHLLGMKECRLGGSGNIVTLFPFLNIFSLSRRSDSVIFSPWERWISFQWVYLFEIFCKDIFEYGWLCFPEKPSMLHSSESALPSNSFWVFMGHIYAFLPYPFPQSEGGVLRGLHHKYGDVRVCYKILTLFGLFG